MNPKILPWFGFTLMAGCTQPRVEPQTIEVAFDTNEDLSLLQQLESEFHRIPGVTDVTRAVTPRGDRWFITFEADLEPVATEIRSTLDEAHFQSNARVPVLRIRNPAHQHDWEVMSSTLSRSDVYSVAVAVASQVAQQPGVLSAEAVGGREFFRVDLDSDRLRQRHCDVPTVISSFGAPLASADLANLQVCGTSLADVARTRRDHDPRSPAIVVKTREGYDINPMESAPLPAGVALALRRQSACAEVVFPSSDSVVRQKLSPFAVSSPPPPAEYTPLAGSSGTDLIAPIQVATVGYPVGFVHDGNLDVEVRLFTSGIDKTRIEGVQLSDLVQVNAPPPPVYTLNGAPADLQTVCRSTIAELRETLRPLPGIVVAYGQ